MFIEAVAVVFIQRVGQQQGMWKIFQDFLRNPNDVDGTAWALETARQASK